MTRRPHVLLRCAFVSLSAVFVVLAVRFTVLAVTSLSWLSPIEFVGALTCVWSARVTFGHAASSVVATPEGVVIRNPLYRWALQWRDVESVEPTHDGLSLRLRDGTTVVAWATAKSGLRFLKPRVDDEALSYFRHCISE